MTRATKPTDLGRDIVRFFEDFLPSQRGMSPHTIRSYRDSVLLLLRFMSHDMKRPLERLVIADLTPDRVLAFLNFLENERGNGVSTRNVRLGAIHVFARFLASQRPEQLGNLQRVMNVPFKRDKGRPSMEYLEGAELQALFQSIDIQTKLGRRDYALFALMFNTGARVQEVLDVRGRDVRLDSPCQVRLHGKGGKVRMVPLWPITARLLRILHQEVDVAGESTAEDAFLFSNARGGQMTRFGVRYLLSKYVALAAGKQPTLREKRIHPHCIRHSTAIALLKAGVDYATISQWLGHATLNTTMRYARADLDLKRQALSQVFPDALTPPRGGRFVLDGSDLVGWLRKI